MSLRRQITDRWRPFAGEPPAQRVPIGWQLRNGVRLDHAVVFRNGVVVTWTSARPAAGAAALPGHVSGVELGGSAARGLARERRHRLRREGLVFSAPVLRLRPERGWRYRGGALAGGTDDEVFRGETTFRVPATRVRARFTLRCAGEQVTVEVPAG